MTEAYSGGVAGFVAALTAGAAMSALQSLMPAYPLMLATRIVEGASHLAIVVVGPTMIAALVERKITLPEAVQALMSRPLKQE